MSVNIKKRVKENDKKIGRFVKLDKIGDKKINKKRRKDHFLNFSQKRFSSDFAMTTSSVVSAIFCMTKLESTTIGTVTSVR